MNVYLALVLTGTTLGVLLTPLVSSASSAFGLVDAPGGRKVHPASVPRVGGLAIVIAAALSLAVVPLWTPGTSESFGPPGAIASILAGGFLVFAVGLADDLRPLPAAPKLAVQLVAAVLVMRSGLLIERITLGTDTLYLGVLAWPVTLIWLVGLTNAFNLIDGVDGLAAGIAVIAGGTCTAILIARGHSAEAMLLAALVGAALGFLVHNFAPASIFLGDGGSLLFGFVLAATAIAGWQKGATALAAGVPILIFALPIVDSATALIRRIVRRESAAPDSFGAIVRRIIEPDRQHIHHRLLALGWSPRRTVVVLYVITAGLSALALFTAQLE